ncbi:hypothetical protein [Neolewinella persica]|uniref:hypothetical protein n=1 Tax=Neolewinella persica TaxID=70998 RepID=UPI000369716B|nr:hypothetical protein [Neolewinella persica]
MYQLAVLIQQLGQGYLPLDLSLKEGRTALGLYTYVKRNLGTTTKEKAATHLGLASDSVMFLQSLAYLEFSLLNGLSAISNAPKGNDDPEQASRYVWKLIAVAKRQSLVADSSVLIPYLKEAFKQAERHHFTDASRVSVELLALLRANRYYEKSEYRHYREKATYYRELCRRLRKLKSAVNHLDLLERSWPPLQEREVAVSFLRGDMQRYREATNNLRFNLTYLTFEVKCCFLLADYSGVIAKAHEAIDFCLSQEERFHYLQSPYVASLSYALLQTDNYAEGLVYAKKLLSSQDAGSFQYLKTVELIVLLSFRSADFQQASDYFSLLQRDLRTQQWESYVLFSAYLLLLNKAGKIEDVSGRFGGSKTKLKDSLTAFTTSYPDSHNSIHLLLAQAFLELHRRRYANYRRVLEALLSIQPNSCSKRAGLLISALAILPEQAFHRVAVTRHTLKYFEKMGKHKADRPLEEIIPFELLWELFLDLLGMKRVSARKPRTKSTQS